METAPQPSKPAQTVKARGLGGLPGGRGLEHLSQKSTDFVSSPWGTLAALGIVVAWLASAPFVGWTRAWGVMDEVFSASAFLLLFLLQRSQTKSTLAMQVKLNELLAAAHRASTVLINVEDRTESEVQEIHDQFQEIQQRGPGAHSISDVLEGESSAP
jgi:low affinity Fe/Cu permease